MVPSIHSLQNWFRSDARHFQIISQVLFLAFGIAILGWDSEAAKYFAAFAGTLSAQYLAIKSGAAPNHSLKSALITALGLSLLLKANSPFIFLFAAWLAIGQKFLFRINGKHLWNPADFGIVAMMLLGGEAWVSPGQWGSSAIIVFIVGTAGLAVLSRVKRLETGFAFILTLGALEYIRTVLYLGWGHDVFLLKITSGSLWLFSLFMITDPMTSPNSRRGRIIWAMAIALISFYLTNFKFINAAPIWVLFFATPFTPLIDKLFKANSFQWIQNKSVHLFKNYPNETIN